MFVLGIVGTPAGGKSTVASRLTEQGAAWVNADRIAREVLETPQASASVLDFFGSKIAAADGTVDRERLSEIVFGDDDRSRERLGYLESVLHPPTHREIREQVFRANVGGYEVTVLDIPLLFESGWDRCCDAIWCIDAAREIRQRRARERGWSDGELARRESRQISTEEKSRLASLVMQNDSSLEDLYRQVDRRYRAIKHQREDSQHEAGRSGHCFSLEADASSDSIPPSA